MAYEKPTPVLDSTSHVVDYEGGTGEKRVVIF